MIAHKFVYPVLSYTVKDGDTILITRDHGESSYDVRSCRVAGIDTPETKHYRSNPNGALEKQAGLLVKDAVIYWMDQIPAKELMVASVALDKYGRFLGSVYQLGKPKDDLASYLLSEKLALPYDGGRKSKWTQRQLKSIVKRLTSDGF